MTLVVYRAEHEPTDAQLATGNYAKRQVEWRGLQISIETEANTIRRGRARDGTTWEVRVPYDYGYIKGTTGADGEHVDCYLGPDPDAPMVYIVRQRRYGNWEEYDEDKCMIQFSSEDDASAAFLKAYNDPRFLGPIDAMPADEFVAKVRRANGVVKSIVVFRRTA